MLYVSTEITAEMFYIEPGRAKLSHVCLHLGFGLRV